MKKCRKKAFTLVELAIVMTIIGLLIGGVLKGQELLENSRLTTLATVYKSTDAAALTFKDIYKSLPGDIANPANFIQNCTTSPCNISGNNDGNVGPQNTIDDEVNTFWLHLSKAGLINGVNPNSTWTSGTYYAASTAPNPYGGKVMTRNYYTATGDAWFPEGLLGNYYIHCGIGSGAGCVESMPNTASAKLDLKIDDGRPWRGDFLMLHGACAPAQGAANYDPNDVRICYPGMNAAFN